MHPDAHILQEDLHAQREAVVIAVDIPIREETVRPPRRGSSGNEIAKIVIGGVILVVAIACIMFLVKGITGSGKNDGGKR